MTKKFWWFMEIIDIFLLIVGSFIAGLSFVIGIILWIITGNAENIFADIFGFIVNCIAPIWMLIWTINGIHAIWILEYKNKKDQL